MLRSPQAPQQNEEALLLGKEQELARKITDYQHRSWLQNEIPQLRAELGRVRVRLEEVQFQRAIAESKAPAHTPYMPEQKEASKRTEIVAANYRNLEYDLGALQRKKQSLLDEIENYDYLVKQRETTAVQREILTAFRVESLKGIKQIEKAIQNNPEAAAKAPAERKEVAAPVYDDLEYDLGSLLRKKQSMLEEIANYDYLISQAATIAERQTWTAFRVERLEGLTIVQNAIQKNLEAEANVAPAVVLHPPLSQNLKSEFHELRSQHPSGSSLGEEKAEPLNKFDYIPRSRAIRATPVRTFTDAETTLIQQYVKDGQDLDDLVTRPLIEATIMSNTMLELTVAPYSLIPEGWTDYSLQYLEDHFKLARKMGNIYKDQDNKVHPPFVKTPNLDFPCTEDDIIPCNTLLVASGLLLEKAKRWQQGDTSEPQVPKLTTYSPAERRKYTSSAGLSAMDVVILEKIYQSLPPSRQLMFNCILRDETDQIIESAVQLPDGYVYDESVPKKLLKLTSIHPPAGEFSAIHVYEGKCPRNSNITFRLVNGVKNGKEHEIYSEIKPVLYFGRVISLLKEHSAKFVAKFKEKQAMEHAKIHLPVQTKADAVPPVSWEGDFGFHI